MAAATTLPPRRSFATFRARTVESVRKTLMPGDPVTLMIAVFLLLMPALSLTAAGWPLQTRALIPTTVLGVVCGFLLARSRYNELFALIVSLLYGACVVLITTSLTLGVGLGNGLYQTFGRLVAWLIDATTGGVNPDELVFTLLVSGLFWFLAHNLAWHLFRIDRTWRAILPPAIILISNAIYYNGANPLESYLIAFVFLSLLLVVRSNLEAREWEWYLGGVRVPRRLRGQLFRVGTLIAFAIVAIAWLIPNRDLEDRLNRFQEFMQSEPLTQLAELWNRMLASGDSTGTASSDYYGTDSLELGGAIRLGDEVVLLVGVPPGRRYYWRSRVFDSYDSGRWTSAADTRLTDPEAPLNVEAEPFFAGARVPVQQQFTISMPTSRLVYTAPQPSRIDLATRSDLRYAPDEANPGQRSMVISVVRPIRALYRGDTYTATSSLSAATADQLRSVGTNYPQWVRDTYVPYMPSVTGRTIQLAYQIVTDANAVTPYDQAKAIESWLRANIRYEERIPEPPSNQDPVDWLLFDLREGYCNYYASAMIVMLRSLNIPARMAAGFAQGEWNPDERSYVVRERDAHTWVEVYFPGYGWVEFEPTSAQPQNTRPGDREPEPSANELDAQADFQATGNPPAPPTTLPTPTPEPTLPAPIAPTQADGAAGQPSEPTLVPSPTLTATPVIIPTATPPLRPPSRDPITLVLQALGSALILLGVILAIVLVGLFVYWYWAWRGMGGLSPISRVYAQLERYLGAIGIRFSPLETPNERRARVAIALPPIEPPMSAITRLYNAERYGPPRAPQEADQRTVIAQDALANARGRIIRRWVDQRTPRPFRRRPQ